MQNFPTPETLAQYELNARKLRAEALRGMAASAKASIASFFAARPRTEGKTA